MAARKTAATKVGKKAAPRRGKKSAPAKRKSGKKAGTTVPTGLTITCYQVGFGDCFLLTWHYSDGADRHVLIDFGTVSLPAGVPKNQLKLIADDIKATVGDHLDAVVLTHRHRDHLSGFTPSNGTGSGDVIKQLKPRLVIEPWTEQPDLKRDATAPSNSGNRNLQLVAALESMKAVSENILAETAVGLAIASASDSALSAVRAEAMEGIANPEAVKLLQSFPKHAYAYHGMDCGLESILPGVTVTVLGPPTLQQSDEIRKEVSNDPSEFWLQMAATSGEALEFTRGRRTQVGRSHTRDTAATPFHVRWLVRRLEQTRGEQLMGLVRILDKEMNNTSVILLFEAGGSKFLFPGDAQIENWEFTLHNSALMQQLADVDFYKVGHHGSRNATPKTLWKKFLKKGPKGTRGRLATVVSTKAGAYGGKRGQPTEVPRTTLVAALKKDSDFFTTQDLAKPGDSLKRTFTFQLT